MSSATLVVNQVIQVTLLASLVGLVALVVRYRMPRLMYGLWLLVLVKCVIPPLITRPSLVHRQVAAVVEATGAGVSGILMMPKGSEAGFRSADPIDRPFDTGWWSAEKYFGSVEVEGDRVRGTDSNAPASTRPVTAPQANMQSSDASSQPVSESDERSDSNQAGARGTPSTSAELAATPASPFVDPWGRQAGPAPERGGLSSRSPLGAVQFVFLIWSIGTAFALGARLIRLVRFRHQVVANSRPAPHWVQSLADGVRGRVAMRRPVEVRTSERLSSPCVTGWVCPLILIPTDLLETLTPAAWGGVSSSPSGRADSGGELQCTNAIEMVVAHELSHFRRGDLLLGLFQNLVTAVWWFHPLVRLASRQLSLQAELLCDDAVVAEMNVERADYARRLLAVIEFASMRSSRSEPSAVGVSRMSALGRTRSRLERIMKTNPRKGKMANVGVAAVVLLAGALVIPGTGPDLVAQEQRDAAAATMGSTDGEVKAIPVESPAEIVMRSYDFSKQIDEMKKIGSRSDEQCKQNLESSLQFHLHSWEDAQQTERPARMAWIGKQLHVFGTERQQKAVAARLQQRDLSELPQFMISARFFEAQHDAIKHASWSIGVNWFAIPSSGSRQDSAAGVDRMVMPPSAVTYQRWKASSWQSSTNAVPLLVAFLDDAELKALVQTLQERKDANLVQAPTLAVFDSQAATLESAAQRPFKTSVVWEEKRGVQPGIELVRQGTLLNVMPHLLDRGIIGMRFACEQSDIPSVASYELPTKRRDSQLESPRVLRKRLASDLTIREGDTLLFCWLEVAGDRSSKIRLLALTTEVMENADRFKEQLREWELPSDSEQAAMKLGLVPLTHFPDPEAFNRKSAAAEQDEASSGMLPRGLNDELAKWGVSVRVRELSRFEVSDGKRFRVEADEIGMVFPKAVLPMFEEVAAELTSKQVELQVLEDRLVMSFDSEVKMISEEVSVIKAGRGEIRLERQEGIDETQHVFSMSLLGGVECEFDDEFQIRGESLELSDKGWRLQGDAMIRASLDGKPAKEVRGESIEVNADFPAFIVQRVDDETRGMPQSGPSASEGVRR